MKDSKENLLNQTRDKIWKQLHSKLNGEFSYAPLIPKELLLEITEEEWDVKLAKVVKSSKFKHLLYDAYLRPAPLEGNSQAILSFTRKTSSNFTFLVETENFLDIVKKKLLNLHEVHFANPDFDSRFLFKTNDDNKLFFVFSNKRIQQDMLNQKHFGLSLNKGSLTFETEYPIHNIDFLKHLYDWMSSVFIKICLIDSENGQVDI